MSLVNQRIGPYRLVRKVRTTKNYKIYQAVHIRSFKECIIQLAKLEDKLNKKASRIRLEQEVDTIRATNSPYIIPIFKCDFAEIKGKNYLYIRTSSCKSLPLKEWLELQGEGKPLTRQCVGEIMRQAREAVAVFHHAGIAHLNIGLSNFVIETGDGANRPQVYLNDFLPAVLYSESIRGDEERSKKAFTEDWNALDELEKLLNERVEETGIQPTEHLESPLKVLENRLLIVEAENEQLQWRLRELEAEKEHINRELQEQREEEKKRLTQTEVEKEQFILDQQAPKGSDAKPLAEVMLASTAISRADAPSTSITGDSLSRLSRKWFWTPGCLLFLTVLFAGTACLFAILFFFEKPVLAFFDSSTARVTITQASYELTDNYVFTGVTRSISKANTRSLTVPATNVVVIPGKNATGTLTFHNTQNPCNIARLIPAGTVFTSSYGILVATDRAVILGTSCNATAPAHAVIIGLGGNIGAHSIKQTYHATIIVDNPVAFVGGQFAQSYTTVQQSDIEQARNSLEGQMKQDALGNLHAQLQANEQYASSPTCSWNTTSDHQANDVATQVTVAVTVACTAQVYNPQKIMSQSQQMVNRRAQALFGPNYRLTGNMKSEITHISTDAKHVILITVASSGLWTYQFTKARADQLSRLLIGMNKHDAQSILSEQKGAQSVSISISNNGNTMPSKANSIHIAYVASLVMVKER